MVDVTRAAAYAADLLVRQHRRIEGLLGEVKSGSARETSFAELVRLMAAHESVEESLVHPAVDRCGAAGAGTRVHEERELLATLSELYELGVDHVEFPGRFGEFADRVAMHMATEEVRELPIFRHAASTLDARRIAAAIELVETFVPQREPVEGETAVVAPPLPLFTRLCDAVDAGLGRS